MTNDQPTVSRHPRASRVANHKIGRNVSLSCYFRRSRATFDPSPSEWLTQHPKAQVPKETGQLLSRDLPPYLFCFCSDDLEQLSQRGCILMRLGMALCRQHLNKAHCPALVLDSATSRCTLDASFRKYNVQCLVFALKIYLQCTITGRSPECILLSRQYSKIRSVWRSASRRRGTTRLNAWPDGYALHSLVNLSSNFAFDVY